MKLLFDASALLNIVRMLGADALEYLRGCYVLTLTPYEVGNGLWKEATLLRVININEALALVRYVSRVYGVVEFLEPRDWVSVLRLACELRITYYDSAYVVAAVENGLVLVTDDEKLFRRIVQRKKDIARLLGGELTCMRTSDLVSAGVGAAEG